ncbi:MAG: Ppx/GppA phosphatase family protein [Planctomycetota bacterium]|nr:Ppx/GppA phosphatase family protein [Planctomycetota bacterium]
MKNTSSSTSVRTTAVEPEQPSFPVRVAAIDVGSNGIRFSAAEFTSSRKFEFIIADRAPVRLGHGVFLSGRLSEHAMEAALKAFRTFRKKMDENDVHYYRAVATSAVRESSNGEEFLRRVRAETGIELETIDGREEARLVYLAVKGSISFSRKQWLIAELGGGSLELSLVDDSGVLATECQTMGSVRLLEVLSNSDEDPSRFQRLLQQYVSMLKVPTMMNREKLAGFIATGGNIETIAKLSGVPTDSNGVCKLPVSKLEAVKEKLFRLSYGERVSELRLRKDRADVVLPASMVFSRIAELAKVESILVPHVGIKEGVMFDVVDDLFSKSGADDRYEQELCANCVALGRKFYFDEPHAEQVSALAVSLFDQLRDLHCYGRKERRLLIAAGILHDIGGFISVRKHHKHSQYIIENSPLPGVDDGDRKIIANIARYHRKAEPSEKHNSYMALSEHDRLKVDRLGSILRVADLLDREHLQNVYNVKVERSERTVRLVLEGAPVLSIERRTLKKKGKMFTRVFDVKLQIDEMNYEKESLTGR